MAPRGPKNGVRHGAELKFTLFTIGTLIFSSIHRCVHGPTNVMEY